jgi:hypothetical protein
LGPQSLLYNGLAPLKIWRAIEKQKAVYRVLIFAWIYFVLKVDLLIKYGN